MYFKLIDEIPRGSKVMFYKLVLDNGECPYDRFCQEAERDRRREQDLRRIQATMSYMAEYDALIPATKFNSVKEGRKVVGYEFKQGDLRVYCVKRSPGVYLITGGYKADQRRDIAAFKRLTELAAEIIQ